MTVRIALLGVPTDINSSFRRGPAEGPAKIREILKSDVGNLATEVGAELTRDIEFVDIGDLEVFEHISDAQRITSRITETVNNGYIPLTMGGDHSITFPIVQALAAAHGALKILHIDAHPDLYDDFDGNPSSHASPFARILENKLTTRLVQVGVRTLNTHQREQAARFGVEIIPMRNFDPRAVPILEDPMYLSVDLDGFDPAFAPGVSHHEPGGLSTRQVLDVLQAQTATIVGGDVVELNPRFDVQGITAALAVKMLKEIAGLAARNKQSSLRG